MPKGARINTTPPEHPLIPTTVGNLRLRLLVFRRIPNHVNNLGCDLFNRVCGGASRNSVGEGRRIIHDFALCNVVPDRQQDLLSRHRTGYEAVQLVFRPTAPEERPGEYDYTEAAARQALVEILRRKLSPIRSSNSSYQTLRPASRRAAASGLTTSSLSSEV